MKQALVCLFFGSATLLQQLQQILSRSQILQGVSLTTVSKNALLNHIASSKPTMVVVESADRELLEQLDKWSSSPVIAVSATFLRNEATGSGAIVEKLVLPTTNDRLEEILHLARKVSSFAKHRSPTPPTIVAGEDSSRIEVLNDRYRRMLSVSPIVIYNTPLDEDADSTFSVQGRAFIGDNAESVVGYTAEELINNSSLFPSRIHPDDNEEYFDGFSRLFDEKHVIRDFRFRHKKGHWMWLQEEMSLRTSLISGRQEIIGWWHNITLRKQYEEQLRQLNAALHQHNEELERRVFERTQELEHTRRRLDMLLQRSADYVSIVDNQLTIVFESERVAEITGIEPSVRRGKSFFFDAVDKSVRQYMTTQIQALAPDETLLLEWYALNKEGVEYVAETAVSNQLHNPVINGYVLNTRDITLRRRAARQIRKALDKERHLNSMISRILTTISHEYRTPLTTLQTTLLLLQKHAASVPEEKRSEMLERCVSSTARLKELIEKTVTISTLEMNTGSEKTIVLHLTSFLRSQLPEIELKFPEHSIVFETTLSHETDRYKVQPQLLLNIFNNLVYNACQFSPEGSTVVIRLTYADREDEYIISIQDEGAGIPEEEKQRIFEIFYKNYHKSTMYGLGLGLPIAQKSAASLGGRITLESAEGKGSTFTVFLPVSARHLADVY